MAAEENKAILQRFNELAGEVFRTGNVDGLDEVLAPELVYHQPGAPPDPPKLQTIPGHVPPRLSCRELHTRGYDRRGR